MGRGTDNSSHYIVLDSELEPATVLNWDGIALSPLEAKTRLIPLSYMRFELSQKPNQRTVQQLVNDFCRANKLVPQANEVHELDLPVGSYFPGVARVSDQQINDLTSFYPNLSNETVEMNDAVNQLLILVRRLSDICLTVHPVEGNLACFGFEIRNLLIASCTEAEAHFRRVLKLNGYSEGRWNTRDYINLCKPMRLSEYEVEFGRFPWLERFAPFQEWSSTEGSTKSLSWYSSYNRTKHDRSTEFSSGNLRACFDAVAAVAVLLCGQFGIPQILRARRELLETFQFSKSPTWSWSEVYIDPNISYGFHDGERVAFEERSLF